MSRFHKHFKKILSFTVVIAFLFFISSFNQASSSALDNVYGYAWQANNYNNGQTPSLNPAGGMGWLSFNCISMISDDGILGTGNDCGSVDYGLNLSDPVLDPATGNQIQYITGYAWSPNYGWLKFGGLAGQIVDPSRPNDTPPYVGQNIVVTDARVNLSLGTASSRPVYGWARFCSGGPNAFGGSPNCTGATVPNPTNGGWDGWVRLDNTVGANDYGVKLKTNVAAGVPKTFSGYAWGGNDLVAWISFNCSSGGVCANSDYKVSYLTVTAPTVSLQANPTTVQVGASTTLSWTGANIASSSCSASTTFNGNPVTGAAAGGWSGNNFNVPPSSFPTTGLPEGDYVFTITCGTATSSVSVHSGIELYFLPDSPTVFPDTNGVYEGTLRWNSLPFGSTLTGCTASSNHPSSGWNGSVSNPPPTPSDTSYFQVVTVPINPTTYTLDCNETDPITVAIAQDHYPESVSLSSNGVTGTTPNFTTTLQWSTTNASSCVASSSPSTNWQGQVSDDGSQQNVNVPAGGSNTTYSLTCTRVYPDNQFLCPLYPTDNTKICTSIVLNEDSGAVSNIVQPNYLEN